MKYIITSSVWAGELELDYDAAGRLVKMDIRAQFADDRQHDWLLANIPIAETAVSTTLKTEYTKVKQVPVDLSFENFWRLYNLKEERHTTEKLWNALPMQEQIAAIAYIPVYNGKLAQSSIAKKYPATYLRKKAWKS
jgi:hypothetical protein